MNRRSLVNLMNDDTRQRPIFGEVLDGRNARLADGVQRALGREPRDFSDYARDAAAAGIRNARATRAA
jgi:hypothetical protein